MRTIRVLCIPCAADMVMCALVLAKPGLGYRESLTFPFVSIYLLGWLAAIVGGLVALLSPKSPSIWASLAFFLGTAVLNIYVFLFAIGAVANSLA